MNRRMIRKSFFLLVKIIHKSCQLTICLFLLLENCSVYKKITVVVVISFTFIKLDNYL